MKTQMTRREVLAGTVAAIGAVKASGAAPSPGNAGFKLGVASYSLRKLSRAEAIKALETLKVNYVNIKEMHAPLTSTLSELAQAKKDFESAGIKIIGVGNVSFAKDDEGEMRRNFEYAKALGAPVIVMAPTAVTAPKIEKFAKEYNIKAAIHNHGPEDKHFPAPSDVLKVVKSLDPRMGLCIDIGHTVRTGADVLTAIKETGSRLHDMHVKDLRNLMDKDSQVAVGEGAMPIPEIFKLLHKMGFKGGVMLEYEIDAANPVPGMEKSFAYMRRVLAEMSLKSS
jgi:sugar phosphate isomerase/epimerase